MGDQSRFNQKWDFRRKESFDDSSSDNSDSKSSHEPVLKKHKPVSQVETMAKSTTTTGVSRKQPARSQKTRSKKDQNKPEKGQQKGGARKKTACGEGKGEKRKEKEATGGSKAAESVIDGVGTFMETLLDDLKASRESLFDWMKGELCQSDEKAASPLPEKEKRKANQERKRAQPRRAKRTIKNKKILEGDKGKKLQVEEENQREEENKPEEEAAEKNNVEEETENANGEAQERCDVGFDCNVGPLERFIRRNEAGFGRNYFQQLQQQDNQEPGDDQRQLTGLVAPAEKERPKNLASTSSQSQKGLVLGIPAQNNSSKGKKTIEANTKINVSPRDQPRRVSGAEKQKGLNSETPVEPKLSSAPVVPATSSLGSIFPSNQGLSSFASNNFQFRPVSQIQDPSQLQTGSGFAHPGVRNLNGLYQNNVYFPSFAVPFHPGFNFPTQLNSETPLRDNSCNNLFGNLRMSGGAIRFSGSGFPEPFPGADVGTSHSVHRTSSGIQTPFQTQNNFTGNSSLFQN